MFKNQLIQFKFLLILGFATCNMVNAQPIAARTAPRITTLVEFFSFTCSHCAEINQPLARYIATNHIKYLDVNIDDSAGVLATMTTYYTAIDAGIGPQFKSAYFAAVAGGHAAYIEPTLDYVMSEVKTPRFNQLLNSPHEQTRVANRLQYGLSLLKQYQVVATPTFLINQTTLVAGADVIIGLIQNQ